MNGIIFISRKNDGLGDIKSSILNVAAHNEAVFEKLIITTLQTNKIIEELNTFMGENRQRMLDVSETLGHFMMDNMTHVDKIHDSKETLEGVDGCVKNIDDMALTFASVQDLLVHFNTTTKDLGQRIECRPVSDIRC